MYTQLSHRVTVPHETMVRSHMPSARSGRNPSRGRRPRRNRTMESRAEASRRFEMYLVQQVYNKGHLVPDIIEIDTVDTLYEVKCWSPIRKFQALGRGSARKGGAASTNEG